VNVWVRRIPDYDISHRFAVLLKDTPVIVISAYGNWLEVEWRSSGEVQRGWVPRIWLDLVRPLDPAVITPTATPTVVP
jgi:hypothetical protein